MIWAISHSVRFIQQGKKRDVVFAVILTTLGTMLKPNALIVAIAITIVLCIHALRKKSWIPFIAVALIFASAFPSHHIAQYVYENRLDTKYGEGQHYVVWISMSMRESWMADGWYNMYMFDMRDRFGLDISQYNEQAKIDLAERLGQFAENPSYARAFFLEKFSSQWNEPTFESIWAGAVCKPYAGERSKLIISMYDGRWPGVVYEKAMNYSLQLLYVGFLLSVLVMLRKRKPEYLFLPIAILGGVLFHLLCEANAKYTLSYLPLFCPLAAYGILTVRLDVKRWFHKKHNSASGEPDEMQRGVKTPPPA